MCLHPCQAHDSTQDKVLRLGVNNWLFWRSYHEGEFSGIDVEIWQKIAERCGLKLQCSYIPDMNEMKIAMESGSIDVFVGMLRNDEREKYMIYIEPPYRTKLVFHTYVRAGSNITIDKQQDFYGKKIAIVGGGYEQINNDTSITAERSMWWPAEIFEKLAAGNLDAVHINEWLVMDYFKNTNNRDLFKELDYNHKEVHPSYLVVSKKSAYAKEWPEKFGTVIQKMIDDGTMKTIFDTCIPGWYEEFQPYY